MILSEVSIGELKYKKNLSEVKFSPFDLNESKNDQENYLEKYIEFVSEEIKNYNFEISQYVNIHQMCNLIDKLNKNKYFNRLVFQHIIEYENIEISNPFTILDFFHSYFNSYENMKKSRRELTADLTSKLNKIQKIKNKILRNSAKEKEIHDGLTNTSQIHIILKKVQYKSIQNKKKYKLVFFSGNGVNLLEIKMNELYLNKVHKIKIANPPLLTIKIILMKKLSKEEYSNEIEKKINVMDYSKKENIVFGKNEFSCEFELEFIISKFIYLVNLLSAEEKSLLDYKKRLDLLENSIRCLEYPFISLFRDNYDSSKKSNSLSFSQEIYNTEKYEDIENTMMKIFNEKFIFWEKSLFFTNKLMLSFILILIFSKVDFLDLIISIIILGNELKVLEKEKFIYFELLICTIFSTILNILWFIYEIINFKEISCDYSSFCLFLSQLGAIIISAVILCQLIIIFSIWRIYLAYNLKEANPKNLLSLDLIKLSTSKNKEKEKFTKSQIMSVSYVRHISRPKMKPNPDLEVKIGLRFPNDNDDI